MRTRKLRIWTLSRQCSSFVAAVSDRGSGDPTWLIKITENKCVSSREDPASYGNIRIVRERYLKSCFMETWHNEKYFVLCKLSKMFTYSYKVTIIYPFVVTEETKK